ncbi:class I SAM-dependent methyltransferase [Phytomonospora endophytica]|uniref:SAM-dependent methyltransferase n=1 Tax=Phytomonospora endophytica TaxID=714109 RepID=A0A841G1W3_9ACTN|nr:SAM-dependent methyltransferase [Phytomonospora endophytica]MBB6039752.1 SAM-dependent methyltransferase [Phytomonospora endophytica]GIG70912.1 methyltransferase [Phytomonospora endophytica]
MDAELNDALAELRDLLLDGERLVSASAGGRRKGQEAPEPTRIRPVTVKGRELLQLETADAAGRPIVRNVEATAVEELLARPYANWHVVTTDATVAVRITKKGKAFVHRTAEGGERVTSHDRVKSHLLAPDDPLFAAVGADAAKRRQVDRFLTLVDGKLGTDGAPLHVVDFGCGNAYLTFAAYKYLSGVRELDVTVTGVEIREEQRVHNNAVAEKLGYAAGMHFVADTAAEADLPGADIVLALHACDTATDEAIARGVRLKAAHIFAAPCCHHDIAEQLKGAEAPGPYGALVADGILRERFADTLTDALRALLLRSLGYEVEVSEFIASQHTPRNSMIWARPARTPAALRTAARVEYDTLVEQWGVRPKLAELLETA